MNKGIALPNSHSKFEAADRAAGGNSHDNVHHESELCGSHADTVFSFEFFGYQFFLTSEVAIEDYVYVEKADWNQPCGASKEQEANFSDYKNNLEDIYVGTNVLDLYYQKKSKSSTLAHFAGEMADVPSSTGGIPLHEFRREVPPGWAPGIPEYPLRLYFERLKLWYRVFDGQDETVGPLVAGRLQGKAQRLGMQLRLPRPDGSVDVGSDALVRLSVEEVRDPMDPSIVIQQAIPSGVQALCNALRDAFGLSDQELVSKAIEDFFEFKRGKLSLAEYSIEWDSRLEEATTRAGLELNDVGKYYLFFRNSGLASKFLDDIKLQIKGDLRRFQEARSLALRLVTRKDDLGESYYQDDENLDQGAWDDSYWVEDGWSWVETPLDGDYWTESPEDYWGYDSDVWYGAEEGWIEAEYDDYYDEHPDYHSETADQEANSPDDAGLSPKSPESYPVKGGGKGVGCSVCGSRWHSASSCPVGGSKGKGFRGPAKGYGKGKKGFYRPKGKGKGKWRPGKGKGKQKGYYGYSQKTLAQSFTASQSTFSPVKPSKTVHFRLDHEDSATVINLRNKEDNDRSEAATSSSQDGGAQKRLDFTFATSIYNTVTSYHTVRGEKRRGLLVDPGAASGLIGSETLRDLMASCLDKDQSESVKWCHDKTNNVNGISGTAESTLGEVHLPVKMAGIAGTFSADVLGGEGSLCPALLSNPALRKQRATIMCDYFGNGDGVMVVPVIATDADGQQRPSGWHYMRMLLTDSGHYLLPVDDQRQVSNHTRNEISKQMFTWSAEISQKWNDVRHCFLVQENKPGDKDTCRERERCVQESKERDEPGGTTDSNPVETTTSTTSAAGSPASTTTSGGSSPSTTTATSATTADEVVPTSVRASDSSFTTGSNPKTTTSTTSGVFYRCC